MRLRTKVAIVAGFREGIARIVAADGGRTA